MRIVLLLALALAACGTTDAEPATTGSPGANQTIPTSTTEMQGADRCANVVAVEAVQAGDGTYTFSVTVASPDEGWEKYADEWTVWTPEGTALGTRILEHPHETEQPFTRSLSGVPIPDGVTIVVVGARDSVEGYCGATIELAIP
ncbi:MAG: hypothetical protein P1T08_06010 [Acidimicrobiia bacterium]|nr:hypothetical protein [Acidimicrobiia bacterium]